MPEKAVIIRDRTTTRILRIRTRTEPAKLRLCRACRKVHTRAAAPCRAA